jgi:16S rRNA (adenine1518-N6/adenine1519-N6)-dimethyltransferase
MYKPKKKFGQHFLNDISIIENIIKSADLKENDIVWEIGPGLGALTDKLVEQNIKLSVFEIDDELIPTLKTKYSEKCQINHSDILKIDWNAEINNQSIKIVTNLPYQITSPFLYKLTDYYKSISCIVVMLQREVAKRLTAKPGSRDYNFLTIITNFYFDTSYLFSVNRDRFIPPPNVDSAVIKLTPRKQQPHIENIEKFWKMVEATFFAKRKTLRNNLKKYQHANWSLCPIDLQRRAETLTEAEFIELYNYMID